jgi:DNA mismatch repair protein MutH
MRHTPLGPDAAEQDIRSATNDILCKTFGDIDAEINGMAQDERARSKHGVANVVEDSYFGIPTNSSPAPDFEREGIELKVTPLRPTGGDELVRPKERLVLSMVDYNDIAEADHWTEVPALEKKLRKTLIVWYIHLVGEDRADYPIVWWDLWEPMEDEEWSSRIQADFEVVKQKVMDGETPSEKHIEILGTCPKHSGGYNHDNPADSPRAARVASDAHPTLDYAEKRGWSIGLPGSMELFQHSTGLPISKRGRASGIEIDTLEEQAVEKSTADVTGFQDRMPL